MRASHRTLRDPRSFVASASGIKRCGRVACSVRGVVMSVGLGDHGVVPIVSEVDAGEFAQFGGLVHGLDAADGARRTHHQRTGGGAVAAVGDPRSMSPLVTPVAQKGVLAGDQNVVGEDLVQVVTGVEGLLAFGLIAATACLDLPPCTSSPRR